MNVAIFSSQPYETPFFDKALQEMNLYNEEITLTYFSDSLNEQTVKLCEDSDAICVFVNDVVDDKVLIALAEYGICCIALRCAGFNNVDIEAAERLNIKVVRVPAYSPEAVAEHCIALMLTLSRKTHKAYNRIREDNFDLNGLLGFTLHKKTIGIIGAGKIGKTLIGILKGFGANILVCDPYVDAEEYNKVDIDELLSRSDIISLNCPLTKESHHIIDAKAFNKMKPGVMLINTSRGALIDSKACIEALKNRTLGYLGLDVYEQESELFFKNRSEEIIQDDVFSRLISFPNVIMTGHQGFFTEEALEEIADVTLSNLLEMQSGLPLSNEVTLKT